MKSQSLDFGTDVHGRRPDPAPSRDSRDAGLCSALPNQCAKGPGTDLTKQAQRPPIPPFLLVNAKINFRTPHGATTGREMMQMSQGASAGIR